MRWLLLKDLRLLRRSPLLVALLVAYPVAVSVLAGLALSSGPGQPRLAVANLVDPADLELSLGGGRVDVSGYARELAGSVDAVQVGSREAAIARVESGEAVAAIVIPSDFARRLQASLALTGGAPPTVEVLYDAGDPVRRRYVESVIGARLAEANRAVSELLLRQTARYIDAVVSGGTLTLPVIGAVDVLGLEATLRLVEAVRAQLDPGSPEAVALGQVARFAELAAENLDLSKPVLASIGTPVQVREQVLRGSRSPLDAYAAVVAVVVSLMFVAVLLGAGTLAAERDEHTFARLVRGLVPRTGLVIEKVALTALCSLPVALLMLTGLGLAIGLDPARLPLWLAALCPAALAFAAMGVAIGALAREIRTASLLAFAVALPVVLVALVPEGSLAAGPGAAMEAVSAVFPFRPALRALDAAVSGDAPLVHVAHLAALTLAFAALARVALRRFG